VIARRAQFNPVRPALVAALICAAPLLAVAALGVFGPWTDYMAHIARTRLPAYLGHTALVTGVAAFSAGLIGVPLAWLVARYRFFARSVFEWLLALPLAAPAYASAYAWYDLTQPGGPADWLPTVRGPSARG
jgi:iron(III) transport system permease protein